jgi:putative ABC transport system permease protein
MQTLLSQLQTHPAAQSAAVSGVVPMRGFKMIAPVRFPQNGEFSQKNEDMAAFNYVTPEYFELFGIPVLQGRSFAAQTDRANDPKVMVVNQSLARRFFNGNPIGQRVLVPGSGQPESAEIVGVVGDFHQTSPGEPVKLEMYIPIAQQTDAGSFVAVRTLGDPSTMMASLPELVRSIDSRVVIEQMATVDQLMWESVAEERFRTLLVTTYSALAIVLSVIGVYSVVAYSISRRRREIGIRMALGAANRKILAMLLWQGFTPCVVGIVLGFFGSIAVAQSIQSLLFGVTPMDPLTLAASVAVVALTGLSACAVPAYRALDVAELKGLL